MKKIFLSVLICASLSSSSIAQYFQGGFELGTNDTIIFKIKPVGGNITTAISYMEFAFRYQTSQAPTLSTSAPVNNTAFFGNELNVVSFPPNYVEAPYTYIKFVHNTGTILSRTYIQDTEYSVFKVKLSETPTLQMDIQMASNLPSGLFIFGVNDGAGNLFDPESNPQLYGFGFSVTDDTHTVFLLPESIGVEFLSFNATINGRNALLTWLVSGESLNTSNYSIERSADGTTFSSIGQIAARKELNTTLQYNFEDREFYRQSFAYYRIRQNDDNGTFQLSNVVLLKNTDGPSFSILPNPSKGLTSIVYFSEQVGKVNISLFDASGKRCRIYSTIANSGINKFTIDATPLASGIYNVVINTGSTQMVERLLKQ